MRTLSVRLPLTLLRCLNKSARGRHGTDDTLITLAPVGQGAGYAFFEIQSSHSRQIIRPKLLLATGGIKSTKTTLE